jgi:hypothetical protein
MNSLPHPDHGGYGSPTKPQSALAAWLGSEDAAVEAREDIRRRQRADTLRNRAMAQDQERRELDAVEARSLRAEARGLRDQLTDLRREVVQLRVELPDRISRQIADELPELHDCLHRCTEVLRNGTQTRR